MMTVMPHSPPERLDQRMHLRPAVVPGSSAPKGSRRGGGRGGFRAIACAMARRLLGMPPERGRSGWLVAMAAAQPDHRRSAARFPSNRGRGAFAPVKAREITAACRTTKARSTLAEHGQIAETRNSGWKTTPRSGPGSPGSGLAVEADGAAGSGRSWPRIRRRKRASFARAPDGPTTGDEGVLGGAMVEIDIRSRAPPGRHTRPRGFRTAIAPIRRRSSTIGPGQRPPPGGGVDKLEVHEVRGDHGDPGGHRGGSPPSADSGGGRGRCGSRGRRRAANRFRAAMRKRKAGPSDRRTASISRGMICGKDGRATATLPGRGAEASCALISCSRREDGRRTERAKIAGHERRDAEDDQDDFGEIA